MKKGGKEVRKLSSYIVRYWYAYLFAIGCIVTSVVLDMVYPQVTLKIVDNVIGKGEIDKLTPLLITIAMIGVGRCFSQYCKEFTFDCTSSRIASNIRRDLFSHIQTLSMEYFDKSNTGELMARVKDDVDHIWDALGFVGMLIIEVVIHVSIVLYCMFRLDAGLTLLPLVVMIAVGGVAVIMEKKMDNIYGEISEENAALTTVAEENIAGVRTVKAFAREKYEITKFLSHNERYYDLNIAQSKVLVKYHPIFQFVSKSLPVAVVILGGLKVAKGQMTIGTLVAFTEYSRNSTWPMEMIGWLANSFSSAVASKRKLDKIFSERPTIFDKEETVVLDSVKGDIEFENVSLKIDDKEILKDISFKLKAGKTIGIMGATGSGKTSIINLLQRFYDASEGSVKVDGVDVKDMSLEQLRANIAVVMQDVFLFSDSIAENIKMGQRDTITVEDMKKASDMAQASSFIEEMEESYETVIGERGVGLSGGQKQRISIARALAKKNPILVLDDSTSALDMETEYEIQQALRAMDGITKVIIAHRISAVRNADEIIILEDGKIAERGDHESLIKAGGLYYETYKAQYGDMMKGEILNGSKLVS